MDPLDQLGKYQLLKRVAVGGMAEVFVGQAAGPAGFSKLVAIKCIHAELAHSPQFVEMFLDEARLAARLDHPNIVQILDLGRVDEQYFLAMEYIHGKTLRDVIRRATEYGQVLPLDAVFTVSLGVLSALSFAHGRQTAAGTPAPVIHRDVCPQNILISYNGTVKLADFGIAKAHDRSSVTQDGVIKGKVYYMAPERMFTGAYDHRVDIYAFGVVLYELLTGRKLFGKYSHAEMFDPALKKEVPPPSSVVPARPLALDAIVLRLLEPDPERRFQSCAEAIAALEQLMLTTRQVSSTDRLGATVRLLFAMEREEEERELAQRSVPVPAAAPAPPIALAATDTDLQNAPTLVKSEGSAGEPLAPISTHAVTNPLIRADELGSGALPDKATELLESAPTELAPAPAAPSAPATGSLEVIDIQPVRRSKPWAAIAIGCGLALLAAAVGIYALLSSPTRLPARPTTRSAPVPPATVPDGPPVARPASQEAGARPTSQEVRVRLKTRPALPAHHPRRRPRPSRLGTLELTTEPVGKVYLGRRCLGKTPLAVKLPAGAHTLRLKDPTQRLDHTFRVTISAGRATTHRLRLGTGTLRVNAIPWARVFVDGRMLDVTPIKPFKLYAGRHVVELVYPAPAGELRHRTRLTVRSGRSYKVIHNFLAGGR